MADPVTVGTLVAGILGIGAEAVLKSAVGEAVKEGYKALKEKVSHWAAGDVVALETTPASKTRQAVIAEIIDAQPVDEKKLLLSLAEALIARMKETAPAIGMDIRRLTALEGDFSGLNVESGVGVILHDSKLGVLKATNMSVGKDRGK